MPFLALFLTFFLTLIAAVQGGAGYRISGEVRDLEGKPLRGIVVMAIPLAGPEKFATTTTSDANGKFVLPMRNAGSYRVLYNDEPHGYIAPRTQFYEDPNNPSPQLTLTDEAPTTQLNIIIRKNGALTGQAIDAQTMLPIDDVKFTMCQVANRSVCWSFSSKSTDGIFSIRTPFVPFTIKVTSHLYEDWFGPTGEQLQQISVAPGTQMPLGMLMRRKTAAANLAINESEKRPGINLPAPKALAPIDGQLFEGHPRVTRLEWAPVEGAVSYSVEVDYCKGVPKTTECVDPQPLTVPAIPKTINLTATSYEFTFIGVQPGRWRVWAYDKDRREGFKSEWRTFVYLH